MELTAGQQLTPHLRLVRPLGKGGMGTVWVAHHLARQCEVAVKLIDMDDAMAAALKPELRFAREADMAMRIKSPHVVQTLEHGVTATGRPFLVMELLEGECLSDRVEQLGALSLEDVARLVTQVARALTAAHDVGVVHRDIKPDNLFIEAGRPSLYVKVLDFGIAKKTSGTGGGALTATGLMVGSPFFMSPEQMEDAKGVGIPTDIFSLGAVAYYALTGALPFDGDTPVDIWDAKKRSDFVRPSRRRPPHPSSLDAWFERALDPDPHARFSSAEQMATAFARTAGVTVAPAAPEVRRTGTQPLMDPDATRFPAATSVPALADAAKARTFGGGTVPLDLDPDGALARGALAKPPAEEEPLPAPPLTATADDPPIEEEPIPRTERRGPSALPPIPSTEPPSAPSPAERARALAGGTELAEPAFGPSSTAPESPLLASPRAAGYTELASPASTNPETPRLSHVGPTELEPSGRFTPPPLSPAALPSGAATPAPSSASPSIGQPPSRARERRGRGRLIALLGGGALLLGGAAAGLYVALSPPEPLLARCKETQPAQCLEVGTKLLEKNDKKGAFRYLAVAALRDSRLTEARSALEALRGLKFGASELEPVRDACDEGSALGCYLQAQMSGKPANSSALDYLNTRCEKKDAAACAELGAVYDRGQWGVSTDLKEAVAYHRAACSGGNPRGCARLGRLLLLGQGGLKRDAKSAVEHFDKACDKHEMLGCVELGRALAGGLGGLTADPKRGADLFEKACDKNELEGCWELGRALANARGRERDHAQAVKLLDRACSGGVLDACTAWGIMHESGHGGLTRDVDRAIELYQKACDGGALGGCVELGDAYENAKGTVGRDAPKAVKLYQRACDADVLEGCRALASAHSRGIGGLELDQFRAFELYRRACEGDDLRACVSVGYHHHRGLGGAERSEERARELYQRACDGGQPLGCSNLGAMYDHGEGGLPKDEKKALDLFIKACDDHFGNLAACANVGAMHANGKGGLNKDVAHAAAIYQKTCDSGGQLACVNLGNLYFSGVPPIPRDQARAFQIFEKACNEKDARGCMWSGYAYQTGQGVKKDEVKAVECYRLACDGGDSWGCNQLGFMYESGLGGLPRARDRARELYRQACEGGLEPGCKNQRRIP